MKHSIRHLYTQLQDANHFKRKLATTQSLTEQQRAIALDVMVKYIKHLRRKLTEAQYRHAESIAEAVTGKIQGTESHQAQLGQGGHKGRYEVYSLAGFTRQHGSETGARQ